MSGRKKLRRGDPSPSAPVGGAPTSAAHRVTPLRGNLLVPSTYTPARGVPALHGPAIVQRVDRATHRDDPVAPTPPLMPAAPKPTSAPTSLRERARGRAGRVELLVFRIGLERFGVELGAVEEAIDLEGVHHVPEMPPAMLGVITVRGALTPVYSPRAVLGLALVQGSCALVFRRGGARFALVIDDVDDVVSLDLALLRPVPGAEENDGVLLGVVRTANALLALVDADALLAACQAAPALEIA